MFIFYEYLIGNMQINFFKSGSLKLQVEINTYITISGL